jgi:hypothetical protein
MRDEGFDRAIAPNQYGLVLCKSETVWAESGALASLCSQPSLLWDVQGVLEPFRWVDVDG